MDAQSKQKYFAAALSAGTFNSVNDAPFFPSVVYSQCNQGLFISKTFEGSFFSALSFFSKENGISSQ